MINGKVIYTPKGAALEYGRIGANFYTGCPHDCEYCYLKRGIIGPALGGTEVQLKKTLKDPVTAFQIFEREVAKHIDECRKYGIFFSFTCDPLISDTRYLTLKAIGHCAFNHIPVWVLTKDATFIEDEDFMSALKYLSKEERGLVHFGFTLTGRDKMEPGASKNRDRIETMGFMKYHGFKTFASIEPVIDWKSSMEVVEASLKCCDHYKIGLRSGVKKDYYKQPYSIVSINELVNMIVDAGRTVYLKQSVRRMLEEYYPQDQLDELLSKTVDIDGRPINNPKQIEL